MTPDFTLLLVGGMVLAVVVLGFVGWRFGGPDALAFSIVSGGFTAVMDFNLGDKPFLQVTRVRELTHRLKSSEPLAVEPPKGEVDIELATEEET